MYQLIESMAALQELLSGKECTRVRYATSSLQHIL